MRAVVLVTAAVLLLGPSAALAASVDLPTPEAARVQQSQLITAVGGRPDRLKHSVVPGPVANDETVDVGLGPDGSVRSVLADQRLDVEGVGDYAIRERGPARSATSLSDEPPPLTQRGAVVWQGFTPGRRLLAARLVLDPAIEAVHLPLTVTVSFSRSDGAPGHLGAGGLVPGAGTVTVTVTNATSQPADLPTGEDVTAAAVAGPLDLALRTALRPAATRLPSTDDRLPQHLAVTGAATVHGSQAVPLRLTGSLRVTGTTAQVSGSAVAPTGAFAGTLGSSEAGRAATSVSFAVRTAGAGRLVLDLRAVAALNAAELAPPRGLASWAAWAASAPPLPERKAALDLLVAVAASGARASSYSPYLGADLVGPGSTSYRWGFAPAEAAPQVREALHPRWLPLSVAGALLALLLVAAGAVWRRS